MIARAQLLAIGWSADEIEARLANGRLHRLFRGVYAVGRPHVERTGWWMAAVLACGDGAVLSHASAAALYRVLEEPRGPIHVSLPLSACRSQKGIAVHRRVLLPHEITTRESIPVTTPAVVITDLAATMPRGPLEGVINEASIRRILTPAQLRAALDEMPRRAGRRRLRLILDRRTFRFTRSQLERVFIPIALSVGLPRPLTCVVVNGWEVDFYWPDLNFVVETDGLTFHRTPAQQAKDALRDQAHAAANTERLRFTHSQIRYEPAYVTAVLGKVARRLREEVRREPQELRHR